MRLNKDIQSKLQRFRKDKRAYTSFLLLLFTFVVTLPTELICNVRPLLLVVDGKPYFPIFFKYSEKDFGGSLPSEPNYKSKEFIRLLKGKMESTGSTPWPDTSNSQTFNSFFLTFKVFNKYFHLMD